MYYILNKDIRLKSWRLIPYAYYDKKELGGFAKGLKEEEFNILLKCDAKHDIEKMK